MSDVPLADTCVCGVSNYHRPVGPAHGPTSSSPGSSSSLSAVRAIWCRRCGSIRFLFDEHWQIPLDRAGDIARSVPLGSDEQPTSPGTPTSKKKGDGE